jgi:hypothetical protein
MSQYESGMNMVTGPAATLDSAHPDILRDVYKEVCNSYHAIDEFRAKLLGILPIASLAGILVVGKEPLILQTSGQRLIGFASFFAAAFTLALFLFEIRGILRCHLLIERGAEIEKALRVRGQFCVCTQQSVRAGESGVERVFNAKTAASGMYSLVFSAWLFLALKFSFDFTIVGCGLTAIAVGGVLAIGAYALLTRAVAS